MRKGVLHYRRSLRLRSVLLVTSTRTELALLSEPVVHGDDRELLREGNAESSRRSLCTFL